MTPFASKVLSLARIQKVHGLTSLLKVTTFGELLSTFKNFELLNLYSSESLPRDGFLDAAQNLGQISVCFVRTFLQGVVIKVEEREQRESLEKLRGLYLGLSLADAKKKYENREEPYLFQYVGLNVFSISEEARVHKGFIERVEIPASQAILTLYLEETLRYVRIPLVDYFVKSVNFDLNEIDIMYIENFL